MALKLGTTSLNKLYLGSTEIKTAYLGADVLFSSGFNPLSLFGAGDDGWYWEPSLATTFTDVARTTSAAVGDGIGGVTDLSGKANHGFQGTASRRMVLRQAANGSYYYESDAVDDVLRGDMSLSGKRMTVAMAYRPIARASMLMYDGIAQDKFIGVTASGSSNDGISRGATINSLHFDNVLSTGTTRGDLYTSVQASKSFVLDTTLDAVAWEPGFGRYSNFDFYAPGDIFALFGIDRELTATERANLDAHLSALVP